MEEKAVERGRLLKPHRRRLALFALLMTGMGAAYELVHVGGPRGMLNGCFLAGLAIWLLVEIYAFLSKPASGSATKAAKPADIPQASPDPTKPKPTLTQKQVEDWLQKIWSEQQIDRARLNEIHLVLQRERLMPHEPLRVKLKDDHSLPGGFFTELEMKCDRRVAEELIRISETKGEVGENHLLRSEESASWAIRGVRGRSGVFMGYVSLSGAWTVDRRQVKTWASKEEAEADLKKLPAELSVGVSVVAYRG